MVQLQVSKTYSCCSETVRVCLLTCAAGRVKRISVGFCSYHTPPCRMLANAWCSRRPSLHTLDLAAGPQLLTCLDDEESHCKEEIDANHDDGAGR